MQDQEYHSKKSPRASLVAYRPHIHLDLGRNVILHLEVGSHAKQASSNAVLSSLRMYGPDTVDPRRCHRLATTEHPYFSLLPLVRFWRPLAPNDIAMLYTTRDQLLIWERLRGNAAVKCE